MTNATKVCSARLSGSKSALPMPHSSPEKPDPTVAAAAPPDDGFDRPHIAPITCPSGYTSSRQRNGESKKYQPPRLSFIGRQYDRDQGGVDHVNQQNYRDVLVESSYLSSENSIRSVG